MYFQRSAHATTCTLKFKKKKSTIGIRSDRSRKFNGLLVHIPDRWDKKTKQKKTKQKQILTVSLSGDFFFGSSNLPTHPHQSIHEHSLENAQEAFTPLPRVTYFPTTLTPLWKKIYIGHSDGASPDSDSMGESESESGLESGLGLYPCGLGLGLGLHLCGLGLKHCGLGLWSYGLGLGLGRGLIQLDSDSTVSPDESGKKSTRQKKTFMCKKWTK